MSQLTFGSSSTCLNVDISFERDLKSVKLTPTDSVLVIGKVKDLKGIKSSDLGSLLKDLNVQDSWFDESIGYLCHRGSKTSSEDVSHGGGGVKPDGSVSWLNKLIIETLSDKCSRNNTPSRAHQLTKLVHRNSYGLERQCVVVVCERSNAVASASAIARAYPLISLKTTSNSSAKPPSRRTVHVLFMFKSSDNSEISFPSEEEVECFGALARSIRLAARITDTPCADMNTDNFLDEVKIVAKELGLEPLVIEGEELNKRGFGGLYNVGKAAVNPPKLVVLSSLRPGAKRTVAWVGKGIVYDTGGLCIKSRQGMCTMKRDCGGAAAILSAFYTAVKLGFEDNLHAVLCLAENAVGPNAYRPDDIIKLYSGKTVEITNTDAEGRLVLGDGVAYARKDLKADVIVDMATLTGAQGAATGRLHAAILTNSEKWERACVEAGRKCGDLCFPLVYAPEIHFHEFRSEIADMTNSVKKADNAASACAGLFIQSHLGSNFKGITLHIDIAAPCEDADRATGFGVALLNSLFGKSSHNPALKQVAPESELPIKSEEIEHDDE